jgi:hypothetical protein
MPNRLHRYYGGGYLHFITTSCYQRRALLGSRKNRDLFLKVLEQVRRRYRFVVVGYGKYGDRRDGHLIFACREIGVSPVCPRFFRPTLPDGLRERPEALRLYCGQVRQHRGLEMEGV